MKRICLYHFLLLVGVAANFAQCDKNVVLTASKTEYLNADGIVQRVVEEMSRIEINKLHVTRFIPGSDEIKMRGIIKSSDCKWKTPFKEGKTIIKAAVGREGEAQDATFTIEGKNGKVTLLVVMEHRPDRKIKLELDKFEEKK
jgi:hypothetical protein